MYTFRRKKKKSLGLTREYQRPVSKKDQLDLTEIKRPKEQNPRDHQVKHQPDQP